MFSIKHLKSSHHSFYTIQKYVWGAAQYSSLFFAKVSKIHNNGKEIGFINPSECRMGNECLWILCVYHLKDVLYDCIPSKVFLKLKKFQFIGFIIMSQAYWDFHCTEIQALYPLYHLCHLAVVKELAIDKAKYYIMQIDHLMDDGIESVHSKLDSAKDRPILQRSVM